MTAADRYTFDYTPVPEDTLAGLLIRQAKAKPDFTYAIFPEETATFGQLYARALAFAGGLHALGLKPGDHVAILMPNCLDYMVAHFGVQLAGGIGILLNARFKSFELAAIIGHCDAKYLITTSKFDLAVNYADTLTQTFPELAEAGSRRHLDVQAAPCLEAIVMFGDRDWAPAYGFNEILDMGRNALETELAGARSWQRKEKTAVMYYTSGTTSMPKACEISHAALQRSWSIFARTVGLREGEKVWVPMPFFHSGGIGLMAGLMAHGAAMASAPYFDPDVAIRMIEQHRIEHLYPGFHLLGAPVLQSPTYDRDKFDFVRTMVVIGPLGTTRQLQALLPDGAPVLNLYGMSEAAGLVTLAPYDAPEDVRLTVAGKPLPGIEVRICNLETGDVLSANRPGEIQFRDGGAFSGYFKDEAATARTIIEGGWIRTGDQGKFDDDGYLYFLGRLKDMLRVGGENVAAAEIESFLSGHPSVANVQVIGRPDDRMGDLPVAFVEFKQGLHATAAELVDFCTGKIARYKIPREIYFVTEWPMSATKIQKFKLKELLPPRAEQPACCSA